MLLTLSIRGDNALFLEKGRRLSKYQRLIERGEMQSRRENQTNESNSIGKAIAAAPGLSKGKGMIRELVSLYDVRGAAIVGVNGSIISWHSRDGVDITQYTDYITTAGRKNIPKYHPGMFNESIVDFNGHKILLTRIRPDLMLMLVIDKRAYLGLTMLDVECCIRENGNSLDDCASTFCEDLG